MGVSEEKLLACVAESRCSPPCLTSRELDHRTLCACDRRKYVPISKGRALSHLRHIYRPTEIDGRGAVLTMPRLTKKPH